MARSYAASAVAVYILSQEPSENFEPEAVVVKPRKVFAKKKRFEPKCVAHSALLHPPPHDPACSSRPRQALLSPGRGFLITTQPRTNAIVVT